MDAGRRWLVRILYGRDRPCQFFSDRLSCVFLFLVFISPPLGYHCSHSRFLDSSPHARSVLDASRGPSFTLFILRATRPLLHDLHHHTYELWPCPYHSFPLYRIPCLVFMIIPLLHGLLCHHPFPSSTRKSPSGTLILRMVSPKSKTIR